LIEKTLGAAASLLDRLNATDTGQGPMPAKESADGEPACLDDTVGDCTVAPATVGRDSKPWRRRLSTISKAFLWLLLFSWIVFPIYDLLGGLRMRTGAFRTHARRGVTRSGDPVASGSRIDRILAAWMPADDWTALCSGAGDSDDDERCKRCLGTNCGVDDPPAGAATESFLSALFFWR
jgi:hypothetical protein